MASPKLDFCTFRVHGRSADLNETTLRTIVSLGVGEGLLYTSLAPDPYRPRTSARTGTITWNQVPDRIKELSLNESDTIDVSGIAAEDSATTIDSHFRGLTPLNAGSIGDDGAVIIVAITGVGGTPFMSWQHKSGGMWLRDFLPRDIPKARVFTYGYSSKLLNSASYARLADYADAFLDEIDGLIMRNTLAPRPIILMGHSFGGLIIKNALINAAEKIERYGRLLKSIYSVVFLGVPHRGLDIQALKEMVAKEPTRELITELEEGSTLMRSMSEKFPKIIQSLKIVTCWELDDAPTMEEKDGQWGRTGPPRRMVSESSAKLFLANEERIPMKANHSTMAKLSDEPGSEYHSIKSHLSSHVDLAPEAVTRRFVKQECASALSEVYALAGFVYTIVGVAKGQRGDMLTFESLLADELSFLEAFADFLVDGELGAILDDQGLSTNWPRHISNILHSLKSTFSSFTALASRFHEPYKRAIRQVVPFDGLTRLERPGTESLDMAKEDLLRDVNVREDLLDPLSLGSILRQFQQATSALRQAIAFATLCSLRFGTQAECDLFQTRTVIQQTHLSPVVRQQHLMKSKGVREAEPLVGTLEDTGIEGFDPELLFMKFVDSRTMQAETVIVEYRYYDREPRLELSRRQLRPQETEYKMYLSKVKSLIPSLAGLLYRLSSEVESGSLARNGRSLSNLNCLPFLGFLEQSDHNRFAFLFKPPETVSLGEANGIVSLSSFIEVPTSQAQPSRTLPLEQRYVLACRLCEAILDLHACGWVHKNIQSPNILVVPQTNSSDNLAIQEHFQEPSLYLKGFEIARPQQNASSSRANYDPITNLYRHTARQDAPTVRFRKEHDIYALGVVLLEIGIWQTVASLFEKDLKSVAAGGRWPSPAEVKAKLLKQATELLPPLLGTGYAGAVRKCLNGDFGVSEDDQQQTKLGLELRKQVLERLEPGVKL